MNQHALLAQEWQTLQNNHEQHEKFALLIKLLSLALCLAGLAFGLPLRWTGFAVALCWLLEGVFKTFQARLGERLLRVEYLLRQDQPGLGAMQLHSEWSLKRPGVLQLLLGYAASAGRPTVTLPYLPLLLALGCENYFSLL
jgi:hypothetical protein